METQEARRDDPVVYLATVPNEPLAQMWAETLRRNGIEVMVKPLGPGLGAWGSAFTFEHELHVLKSQLPQALLVIQDLEAPAAGTDAE
ncbi:MAG TPA: hypothetical protein VH482_19960 [Thermomicrobiales bacterium]|jgi:hypothetical protein